MSEVQENVISGTADADEFPDSDPIKLEDDHFSEDSVPTSTTNDGIENIVENDEEEPKKENNDSEEQDLANVVSSSDASKPCEEISTKSDGSGELSLKSPLANWMLAHGVSGDVMKLLYWKKLERTLGVFVGTLFVLCSLYCCSFLSVVTSLALALLFVSFLYRIGMTIVNAVQKTSAEHPLRNLLDAKIEISEETAAKISEGIRQFINCEIKCMQKLFLVENVFQSIKFGILLWLASYIGAMFSLLTMVILSVIILFTIPKLYEEKQAEIDKAFAMLRSKFSEVSTQLEEKLPEKLKKYVAKDKKE